MRAASEAAKRLLPGVAELTWEADLLRGSERLETAVPLSDVRLAWDGTAKVEATGSCDIVRSPRRGESWIPRGPGDMLAPFGTELALVARVRVSGLLDERIAMGVFPLTEAPSSSAGYASIGGERYVIGERISLVFKDRMHGVIDDKFTRPVSPGVAPTCYAELERLTGYPVTRTVADKAIRSGILYEKERDEAVEQIAGILGGDAFFNSAGNLEIRPGKPGAVAAVLDVKHVAPISAVLTADGVFNGIVVTGKAEDGSEIRVERWLPRGHPLSPWGWRRIPKEYHSDYLYTVALVGAEADRQLAQLSKPAAQLIETSISPHPLLEVGDVVDFRQPSGVVVRARLLTITTGVEWTVKAEVLL